MSRNAAGGMGAGAVATNGGNSTDAWVIAVSVALPLAFIVGGACWWYQRRRRIAKRNKKPGQPLRPRKKNKKKLQLWPGMEITIPQRTHARPRPQEKPRDPNAPGYASNV